MCILYETTVARAWFIDVSLMFKYVQRNDRYAPKKRS